MTTHCIEQIVDVSNDKLLTTNQAAEMLQLHARTLGLWRHMGRNLPYIKLGSKIRYREADVIAFKDADGVNLDLRHARIIMPVNSPIAHLAPANEEVRHHEPSPTRVSGDYDEETVKFG